MASPEPEESRPLDELLAEEEAYYSYASYFGTDEEEAHETWRKWKQLARLRSRLKAGEGVVQEAREALGLAESDT